MRYRGAASVELELPPDQGQMIEWVTEAHRCTRKLLVEAGLRSDVALV
jgi:hypothetical protein